MRKNSRVISSTVEMLDIDQVYDVAVIDEAQMIADSDADIPGHVGFSAFSARKSISA